MSMDDRLRVGLVVVCVTAALAGCSSGQTELADTARDTVPPQMPPEHVLAPPGAVGRQVHTDSLDPHFLRRQLDGLRSSTDADGEYLVKLERLGVLLWQTASTEIFRLESAFRAAPEREQPALLLQLGRLKRLLDMPIPAEEGGAGALAHDEYIKFVEARPNEFSHDSEITGAYFYRGTDLRHLISRFPDHELLDDVAYELTLLTGGGECEGDIHCYIYFEWRRVQPFLHEYPTSPFAEQALDRVIASFEDNLKREPDPAVKVDTCTPHCLSYDPSDIRSLLAAFDSVTSRLPPNLAGKAGAFSSQLRERLKRR